MKLYKYGLIPAALLIAACGTEKHLTMPAAVHTPAVYGKTDTIRPDNLRTVFNDQHLQALIDTVMAHNFDLLAANQRIEAARAQLMLARNANLPSLDLQLRGGVEKYGEYTLNGVGNFDTNLSPNINKDQRIPGPTPDYFAGLRSSWEADIWGKLKTRKKAAYQRLLAAEEGRRLLKTQLVAAVTGMYYELTALDYELEIIRSNVRLQESAVATVNIQKAGGRATELAVQQFSAQLLSTQALEFAIKQDIASIEFQLNAILGRLPQQLARNGFRKDSLALPVMQGISAQQLLARPDVQMAEREMSAAKLDVAAARKAFFPSLTISPFVGFNSFKAPLLFQSPASLAWGIVGGLTAPVFNQRQLKAGYNISKAGAYTAFYHYQQTVVNSYQEVATAMNAVDNQQKTYQLKRREVDMLKQAVSTANILYSTGYASYLEVITAQKSVLEAELALVNTRRGVYRGLVSLYRALGGS